MQIVALDEQVYEIEAVEFPLVIIHYIYIFLPIFRFRQIKQQYDLKVHEAELVQARLKQSTHHHQLEDVEALQKTVGTSTAAFIINCSLYYI